MIVQIANNNDQLYVFFCWPHSQCGYKPSRIFSNQVGTSLYVGNNLSPDKKGVFLRVCGDQSPLPPYLPPGLGCVNQFSLVLASSSSIANEAYPRSINMNHDRLTLYYRSTISHFLLDLLNPTGTGVGAARPSNHLAALEEGRLWPNKDQAEPLQCSVGVKDYR